MDFDDSPQIELPWQRSALSEYSCACFLSQFTLKILVFHYFLLAGDYNLYHVCVCMRECVKQFSLKLLQYHIFGKLLVLMNFYALQYFGGFCELAYF